MAGTYVACPGELFDTPLKFQVQQNNGKLPGSQPQFPRQIVDMSGLFPQGNPN